MQIKKRILAPALATLTLALMGAPLATHAQDQSSPPSSTAPDNSARNKAHANTADNQQENTSDREITRKIRRSITSEKSLSTYAHNIKVITANGGELIGPFRKPEVYGGAESLRYCISRG